MWPKIIINKIKNISPEKKAVLNMIYIQLYPLLIFLALEILNMTLHDARYSYITTNIPVLIISYLLLYLVIMLLFAISGWLFISGAAVSALLLVFYVVSFYRRLLTGNVLIPMDLNLATQVNTLISFSAPPIRPRVFIAALPVVVLNIPLFYISRSYRPTQKGRVVLSSVLTVLIYILFFTRFSRANILPFFNVDVTTREGINHLYESDGALMGFYTLCFAEPSDAPPDYSKSFMNSLVTQVLGNAEAYNADDGIRPDVIVIMSEAFADPTRMPNVEYSKNPVPNLHKISEAHTGGYVVTPTFGGMTCNTEYEFLTGNAMKFVGYGDTPYYSGEVYIDKDNGRSLVTMFKKNGYKTIGLHTNTTLFYDRNVHYPKLGFDLFIGEEMMPDAKRKGLLPDQSLISDEYFTDCLLRLMEDADEPMFIYGITMQNHSAYTAEKYASTEITAKSELLTEEDIISLETYLEGIKDADAQLGRLYDNVMSRSRPTIVVFFGDHLPAITHGTEVYNQLGYVSSAELTDFNVYDTFSMYTTPYVAFSNYKSLDSTWGNISPYFLGAVTAHAAGIKKNLYYTFLMQAFESFKAMTDKIYISADSVIKRAPERSEEAMADIFRAFQYDKLFGQDYAGSRMSELIGE